MASWNGREAEVYSIYSWIYKIQGKKIVTEFSFSSHYVLGLYGSAEAKRIWVEYESKEKTAGFWSKNRKPISWEIAFSMSLICLMQPINRHIAGK